MSQSLITRGYGGSVSSIPFIILGGLNVGEAAAPNPNVVIVYDRVNINYTFADYLDIEYTQSDGINIVYNLPDWVNIP